MPMAPKYYPEDLLTVYQNSFRNYWALPALTEYGSQEILTYGEFARRIARIHIFYQQMGLHRGDKVALLGRNSATWVTFFMATITYGATIVPILSDFNANDSQHIINHSEATLLIVANSIWETLDYEQLPMVRAVLSLDTRLVLAERPREGHPTAEKAIRNLTRRFRAVYRNGFGPENICYEPTDKDAMAILNYTSGTTGFSKA